MRSFLQKATNKQKLLERVADTEVECGIFEAEVLYPAVACGQVGVVQSYAPVESEHCHVEVEAYTEAGVEAELLVEGVELELGVWGVVATSGVPYVTHVEE